VQTHAAMRFPVKRFTAVAVAAVLQFLIPATFASCHSDQVVVTPPQCSEPCCGGNPFAIDCAENPTLTCTTTGDGDVCTAQEYGCDGGKFYAKAAATLPATCPGADGGSTDQDAGDDGAVFETDDGGGTFGGDDAADGGVPEGGGGADGAASEGGDAGADAADGAPDDAPQGQQ
jgi:hypothetical protein